MASRDSGIMSEERGELEDTPDGYHVGLAYISGLVWFYHVPYCAGIQNRTEGRNS